MEQLTLYALNRTKDHGKKMSCLSELSVSTTNPGRMGEGEMWFLSLITMETVPALSEKLRMNVFVDDTRIS